MDQSDAASVTSNRSLTIGSARFAIVGANRSVLNAASWLTEIGASLEGAETVAQARRLDPAPLAILVSGDTVEAETGSGEGPTEIFLWDYEVGRPGVGAFASAVSGVSSVIGKADGAPGVLPVHLPERWTGMFGANLALGLLHAEKSNRTPRPQRIDVSAADILRAFAEQNSGNHAGVPYGWRRHGRTTVEHGGVFPQGFFSCRDGFVAVQARSKQDWASILAAFGNPEWAQDPKFQNPFKLSEDDSEIMPVFEAELGKRDRHELLDLAIETGAPMAPVLSPEEAAAWQIFRPGYSDGSNKPNVPFIISR
ncbi:MAG: CoA transferase [Alphaproteobacteria bacterium]|nr:CoA transferase [Alphaproteobacteria bacterium]